MTLCRIKLFIHNIMGEIHSTPMYEVCYYDRDPKQMVVFGFGGVKSLHKPTIIVVLQPINLLHYFHTEPTCILL